MIVLACEVPTGAISSLPCGCSVVTTQAYDNVMGQPSRACRLWVVVTPCEAHPDAARTIVEVPASVRMVYRGVEPTRSLLPPHPSQRYLKPH